MMYRFSVAEVLALHAGFLFACGSDGPSSPPGGLLDASPDTPASDVAPLDGSTDATDAADVADVADAYAALDAAVDGPPMTTACDNAALLSGCQAGVCTVSATGSPLPVGAAITVTPEPVPADLSGDTLGSALCSIALPAGMTSLPDLHLSIAQPAPPNVNAVLFRDVSPNLSRLVVTSQPSASAVEGIVTGPGDFGATERPGFWSLQLSLGTNLSSSANQASLLKNLSSQLTYGAYYDGTHLFVCNGARLLIYAGIPASPALKPSVVLGQIDLDTSSSQITSSLFGTAGCSGLWSDGTRLVVASGNRILIWNAIPSHDAAPADIVLGQPDFSSNGANGGGVSASTLSQVASVDSDGTKLAAAEIGNNRVLVWNTFPTALDQPADFVVGQPDFTTSAAYNGATPIYQAWGSVFASGGLFVTGQFSPGLVHLAPVTSNNPAADFTVLPNSYKLQPPSAVYTAGRVSRIPGGGLAVRDPYSARIVVLKGVPTGPAAIDFVLGQPDAMHIVSSPVSASLVSTQSAETGLGGGKTVLVPDSNRLLVFDAQPTFTFEPAQRVIGQAGFTTNGQVDYGGISASTLAGPADVAVGQGLVAVADRGNNRVVLYRASALAARNAAASVVLGQPDAESYVANLDQQSPTAARLSGPSGVAIDATHLIVADTENHRVLVWNSVPTATGAPADIVLGQPDFQGRRPNRGRGDANGDGFSDPAADGFFYPTGVGSDGTHLFVADRLNHRVLVWNAFPTANGQAADAVLGQADFTTPQANRGNGPFVVVPDGFNLPTGVALVGTTLWVADTENNRVVRWDNATTAPTPGAFVGQPSRSVVTDPNYEDLTGVNVGLPLSPMTTAGSVLRPRAVAVAGDTVFVSETDSNRVHMFSAASLAPAGEVGQALDTGSSGNETGVNASSLAAPLGIASDGATLWVADSGDHRVVGFDLASSLSTGASATKVVGQPSFLTNGFNQASAAANGVTSQPRAVALAGGKLYIADSGHNRVLVMRTPVGPGQPSIRVYGQPDALRSLSNDGGPPSARTLNAPRGVFADTAHVIIADTGNNRVLVYDPNATTPDASLVLGQATFTSAAPNAGGPGAATMQGPAGAFSDGTSLWVADAGNSRVLCWKTFPTSNDQPADLVLGQPSFGSALPNQGSAAATATSLSFPSAIDLVGGVLYVADTGNNRVVSFSAPPAASGVGADGVLGQPDLASRGAAVTGNDLARLSGPVALADDGENLYVTDRDLGRVLVYTAGTLMSSASASSIVGSVGGLTLRNPGGLAVERTPFFTSRLYIADTGNNDVAVVKSVARLSLQ